MKLARVRIQNFRCYKDEIVIDFDDLTAFVGKNDAGKSTVMDALDIFLNDGMPDKHDASKGGDGKNLAITCEFSDFPSSIILDEEYSTTFQKEYLVDTEGRLVIKKIYSGHTATPKCTSIAAYADRSPMNEEMRQLFTRSKNQRLVSIHITNDYL